MNRPVQNQTFLFICWFLLLITCYFILKISFGILICDDAYITLSHVKTCILHGKPLMSMTNTVNATSTPLYTVILTLATLLFGNAHFMAIVFSILTLFELGTIILLFSIARGMQLPPSFVFLATSAYGLSAGMYAMSASGMETMLYIMLILAAHFLALLRTSVTRSVARIKKTF